jgi:hypothetical protein
MKKKAQTKEKLKQSKDELNDLFKKASVTTKAKKIKK